MRDNRGGMGHLYPWLTSSTPYRVRCTDVGRARRVNSVLCNCLPTCSRTYPESSMPGQKGKRSERRCIDKCGSTNPKTIARHKREWQSSLNVKSTKFAASSLVYLKRVVHWQVRQDQATSKRLLWMVIQVRPDFLISKILTYCVQ